MNSFLTDLYSNSNTPVWSAILLGFMTAISPCPMAANITAIGYISRNIENKNRVFYNGIVYALGRIFSYTVLALIIYVGANQFKISSLFQKYGEKILGPLLLITGLIMINIIRLNFPGFINLTGKYKIGNKHTYWDVFLLGILLALTFCPYNAILYFGMLIPLTIQSSSGLFLPFIFALATSIPIIIFSWLLAYTVSGIGRMFNRMKNFEKRFRRIIAFLFVGAGVYYIITAWISCNTTR